MQSITDSFKNASVNGQISLDKALKIVSFYEQERQETKELLRRCEKESGMVLGESINEHLSKMDGRRFNEVDYHYEKPVGEQ